MVTSAVVVPSTHRVLVTANREDKSVVIALDAMGSIATTVYTAPRGFLAVLHTERDGMIHATLEPDGDAFRRGEHARLLRGSGGGARWREIIPRLIGAPGAASAPLDLAGASVVSTRSSFAIGDFRSKLRDQIWRTSDGGSTWHAVETCAVHELASSLSAKRIAE